MMPFFPEALSDAAIQYLTNLQDQVDQLKPDRQAQYLLADDLWRKRKNRKAD